MIHLGYETGTGKAVEIPLAHLAVTGQTQLSGKTTTLEALIDRGDLRAVVFVTKPGEKSFAEGRRILPYFRERADWEYVKELLEARRGESLSKWDGYLMRVCQRAKTLADVRDNVEEELPKKKTSRPSHYEVLAGYLDLLVPELARVEYTETLELVRGINVMDLSELSDEMQTMVLRSTIERIHQHEKNTVLVLPEAWKFIPEGERSAVFDALHALIREGATNRNFIWIDAQDIAVVSKRILKSVSVWILGRQNEANEVARTINHLIEPLAVRPDMIKTLGIGQFLVCAGGAARRVYVQPKWLGALDAQAIARGEESVETAQRIFMQKRAAAKTAAASFVPPLTGAVPRAPAGKKNPPPPQLLQVQTQEDRGHESDKENPANRSAGEVLPPGGKSRAEDVSRAPDTGGASATESEDPVWQEKYEELEAAHRMLIAAHDAMVDRLKQLQAVLEAAGMKIPPPVAPASRAFVDLTLKGLSNAGDTAENGGHGLRFTVPDLDYIYKYVTAKAENDPRVLRVLASHPEIQVSTTAKVLEVDETQPMGAIALLIHAGFFSEPRNGNAVCKELIDRRKLGFARRTLYDNLETVTRMGFLVHEGRNYHATGQKVKVRR